MSNRLGKKPFWWELTVSMQNWMKSRYMHHPRQLVRTPDMKRGKTRERTKRTNQQ